MSLEVDDRTASDAGVSSKAPGQEPGLLETAKLLEHELRSIAYDHLTLAALETRQAGESLVRIIAMGVIAAGLLLTAWLALVSSLAVALVQYTLVTTSVALLLVFVAHCLAVTALVWAIRERSKSLMFPATISRLKPTSLADSDTERAT